MQQHDKPVLVFDGLCAFSRHFCANPTMSEHGEPAGGFVGFLKSIGSLSNQFLPSKVVVVWESGGNSKRKAISGGTYKDGRRPRSLNRYYNNDEIPNTAENHSRQVALTIEALKCLPVCQLYIKDTEADDIIGYICRYKFPESRVVVVSSDKDLYQLIDDRVSQWSLNQKKLIGTQEVKDKFGIYPENLVTARCFTGDDSDAIPGVKGAGFRTLLKRFPELGGEGHVSVGQVVKSARLQSESSNLSLFKEIIKNEERVRTNWKLMHLDISRLNGDQVKKLEHQLGTSTPQPNKINLLRMLSREGLRNIDIDSTYASLRATTVQ